MKWTFYDIWNESLENRAERPITPRERMWASELGGSYVDRYLKMTGTMVTNPPNPRSLRKFEAGNIMEWLVGVVLKRAGLLIENQEWLQYQYPGLLQVTGKLDYFAGGKPDYEKAKNLIDISNFPPFITKAALNIIENFKQKYPDGLDEVVLEIKSCGSYMFDLYEKNGIGNPNHQLQCFHYLKSKNIAEGHIVYISKDDLRMLEVGIYNPSETEDIYKKDIETMTNYLRNKEQPPKEQEITYDYHFGRFSANWKVGYSNYLTYLYGYKNQMEFDETNKPKVEKWNRVLGRVVSEAKMTELNIQVIEEIKAAYPEEYDDMVAAARKVKSAQKVTNSADQE